MPKPKALLWRIAAAVATLSAVYLTLLIFPQALFAYSVAAEHLVLHSDRPFSESAAVQVLQIAQGKLAKSPLYVASREQHIFICNARWRQMLFFNRSYGVGGVSLYPLSPNVFLRDANIEANQLISPRGTPILGARTLDYFIAHEVTHQLTGQALGPVAYFRLPQYVREGYADYVAKGNSFDYDETRRAFLAGAAELDYQKSGLYLRYHLLVAYLIEHRQWTVMQVLQDPPSQESVEDAVRGRGKLWTGQ